MRDPARIDQVLGLVRQVWMRSPDLRLGQLIANAVRPREPCPEVFAIEDTILARRLERMVKQPRQQDHGELATVAAGEPAGREPRPAKFTRRQGQFLAFIHLYRKLNGRGPAELDMVRHFRVTPPSVHSMVIQLHELGLISREPGVARSIRVAIREEEIPPLEGGPGLPR
jgi:hypothetical protein